MKHSGLPFLWGFILLALFFSCSNDSGSLDSSPYELSSGTGELIFQVAWVDSTVGNSLTEERKLSAQAVDNICDSGVAQVSASVYNQADELLIDGGPWECEAHQATISSVPAGENRKLVVLSLDSSGNILHRGEQSGIPVADGEQYELTEPVVCHSMIPALLRPLDDSAVTDSGLRFEWSLSQDVNADQYQIQLSNSDDFSTTIVDTTVSETYYQPVSAISGTYSWRVRSIDLQGKTGVWSNAFSCSISALRHMITASSGTGGSITPDGQVPVVPGESQRFSIASDTGYHITDVTVDGASQGDISEYTFTNMTGNHTIAASFSINTYVISAPETPEAGGSISPQGGTVLNHGTSQTYTITANPGYYISELFVDGGSVEVSDVYSFNNITAAHTISAVFKAVKYVDQDIDTAGTGETWETAFADLKSAIAYVGTKAGDEIWVKSDTYLVSSTVSINKQVELYGGFTGIENHRDERDFETNLTIIDGQNTTRCIFVSANAILDGFTIRNGQNADATEARAGGLYNDNSSPIIRNCVFDSNTAVYPAGQYGRGGAIYNKNGNIEIQNCTFLRNEVGGHGSGYGGAIYNENCDAVISGSVFSWNQCSSGYGAWGGAIYNWQSTPTITDCVFSENEVGGDDGHGAAVLNDQSNAIINRCRFFGNEASAVYAVGGAMKNVQSSPTITNSVFARNRVTGRYRSRGGAIYNDTSNMVIQSSTIFQNTLEEAGLEIDLDGGGIYNANSSPSITDCIFWGNVAENGMQIFDDATSSPVITYTNIDQVGYESGEGNQRKEPLLGADFHLQANSPCIDNGDPGSSILLDMDQEARPQTNNWDVGADEFLDMDTDQIPDFWENMHGLNLSADDSLENNDGDIFTNLVEFRIGSDPNVNTPHQDSVNRGWWRNDGYHYSGNDSTYVGLAGNDDYRSYFIFDLTGISGDVTSAVLLLELIHYDHSDPSEYITIWDVLDTDHATLETGSSSVAVYNDLGAGRMYGTMIVTSAEAGTVIELHLNPLAIDDINGALGGTFAVGISMTAQGTSTDSRVYFSTGSEERTHQLILGIE